jgi:flavin-dependent dehydrogenase
MAGDSAGLIAPLAGDGMCMALHAGSLAARHVHRFLTGQSSADDIRHLYSDEWRGLFAARLRLSRGLQTLMLRPRLMSAGLRLMNTVPAVGTYLVKNTRDLRPVSR